VVTIVSFSPLDSLIGEERAQHPFEISMIVIIQMPLAQLAEIDNTNVDSLLAKLQQHGIEVATADSNIETLANHDTAKIEEIFHAVFDGHYQFSTTL